MIQKILNKLVIRNCIDNVCKAANGFKELGIKKGDRVTIYLTMIPELAYVMLACARIGANPFYNIWRFFTLTLSPEELMIVSLILLLPQTKVLEEVK